MSKTRNTVPLLTLWYKPTRTLQGLIADGAGSGAAVMIAAIFGVLQSWRIYTADPGSEPWLLALGAFTGVIGLYFYGWLVRNFGRWFGSSVAQAQVRTALGWGVLPWTLLFAALLVLVTLAGDANVLAGVYPLFFAGFIYGYVILLLSVSAALGLSVLKTFLCLVVTVLVSIFPLTFIAQLFFGTPTPAS